MGAALGLAAAQLAYGLYNANKQKQEAKKIRKNINRPDYEIPQATKDMVARARFSAGTTGIPGGAQVEAKLDSSGAAHRRSIREAGLSPVAMMGAFAASQAITDQQKTNLGIAGAEHQDRATGVYLNTLRDLAAEQGREFNWNKIEPYLDQTSAASALENAGMRNEESAVNTALGNTANIVLMNRTGNNTGFQTTGYPANVDPNFRAPQTGYGATVPPANNGVQIPGALNYREGDLTMRDSSGGAENLGPVRPAFNPADPSMQALKQQLETQYGYRLSDTEFMEIARLYGY